MFKQGFPKVSLTCMCVFTLYLIERAGAYTNFMNHCKLVKIGQCKLFPFQNASSRQMYNAHHHNNIHEYEEDENDIIGPKKNQHNQLKQNLANFMTLSKLYIAYFDEEFCLHTGQVS